MFYLLSRAQAQDSRTIQMAAPEVREARNELLVAWQQFNVADPAFVDAAIHRLNAAEQKYGAIIAECKAP